MAQSKHYILAMKRRLAVDPPRDWADRLAAIPGVALVNASARRAYITATLEAMETVRAQFSDQFFIEEEANRRTLN